MTDAYIEGFRKTAAAAGIDPEVLVKQALRKAPTGVSRLWQLLKGGDKSRLKALHEHTILPFSSQKHRATPPDDLLNRLVHLTGIPASVASKRNNMFKDLIFSAMTGGPEIKGRMHTGFEKIRWLSSRHEPSVQFVLENGRKADQLATHAVQTRNELRKVLAARLGVGGAVAGTGAGIASAVSDND